MSSSVPVSRSGNDGDDEEEEDGEEESEAEEGPEAETDDKGEDDDVEEGGELIEWQQHDHEGDDDAKQAAL